jgi:PKD repeat protein
VTSTVRFRSWDLAGNVEGVKSQTIRVAVDSPPVARLTLSPTSGIAPLTVTANASASTDSDATPIATYTFNWGDGTSTGPQSLATATHTYTTIGSFTVTVTVTDTANLSDTATQKVNVKRK